MSKQTKVEGLPLLTCMHAVCPQISEVDFQDSVMTLGFSDALRGELLALYLEHRREIRQILNSLALDLPHYHNLEWRFDVQVDSKQA